jgi:hypothetical protein
LVEALLEEAERVAADIRASGESREGEVEVTTEASGPSVFSIGMRGSS